VPLHVHSLPLIQHHAHQLELGFTPQVLVQQVLQPSLSEQLVPQLLVMLQQSHQQVQDFAHKLMETITVFVFLIPLVQHQHLMVLLHYQVHAILQQQ
jgi:hypothetical protein